MKKIFSLSVCVLATSTTLAAGNKVKDVNLNAKTGNKSLWNISLKFDTPDKCKLIFSKPDVRKPKTLQISNKECKEMSSLTSEIATTDVTALPETSTTAVSANEPVYELKLLNKILPIEFKNQEDCAIQSQGEMKCTKNDLSVAQRLLLKLRGYATTLKRQ